MITTTCFSICGYFRYPIVNGDLLLAFINTVCDADNSDVSMELIDLPKNKSNLSLLLSGEDYSTTESKNLLLLKSDKYLPLSIHFKNIYKITSEIIFIPIDNKSFEIVYMLENEELEQSDDKEAIINKCAISFFEILNPLYACCGTEMFVDSLENIDEECVMNSKFYYMGYVDFSLNNRFSFINKIENAKKFIFLPLKSGNMYIRKVLT